MLKYVCTRGSLTSTMDSSMSSAYSTRGVGRRPSFSKVVHTALVGGGRPSVKKKRLKSEKNEPSAESGHLTTLRG